MLFRSFSAKALDPADEDACGFIRVPDGGPTLWFSAVNPWAGWPFLAAEAAGGPSFGKNLDNDESVSMVANGVTITGNRSEDPTEFRRSVAHRALISVARWSGVTIADNRDVVHVNSQPFAVDTPGSTATVARNVWAAGPGGPGAAPALR